MLVFRINFINNMFMIRNIINHGVFCINGEIKYNPNVVANVGDFISVDSKYVDLIRDDIIIKYRKDIIFWNTPEFMFINHQLMIAIFWREMMHADLEFFSKKIDVYLGSEHYYPTPE